MGSDPESPEEEGSQFREAHDREPDPDPPPVFGSWGKAYAFVIGFLFLLILLFYLFTLHYS